MIFVIGILVVRVDKELSSTLSVGAGALREIEEVKVSLGLCPDRLLLLLCILEDLPVEFASSFFELVDFMAGVALSANLDNPLLEKRSLN